MEIIKDRYVWLDESHPNFERWKRARDISTLRGEFVKSVIEKVIEPKGLKILDLGSGEGETSYLFSKENFIVGFDLNRDRLSVQRCLTKSIDIVCGNVTQLPFIPGSFDLIILQDVIEHLPDRKNLIYKLHSLLTYDGIIYLSTPNRISIFNILSDPHWGVPLISLLKRETIRKYFLKYFRKSEIDREDIAELLSLKHLQNLFNNKFEIIIFTRHSVKELFNGNKGIVWSDFHLKLIRIATKLKLNKLILKLANDKPGIVNKYFTPTFYLFLKKK